MPYMTHADAMRMARGEYVIDKETGLPRWKTEAELYRDKHPSDPTGSLAMGLSCPAVEQIGESW
jgi:hypothetical protein